MNPFLSQDPLMQSQQPTQPNYVQGGPPPPSQPGIASMLGQKAMGAAASSIFGPAGGAATSFLSTLLNDGTAHVTEQDFGPDPLAMAGYNMGTGYAGAMQYAQGTDRVPSMLTPGEAVIPAPAAQDPANQGMIEGMINQGRQMNQGVPAQSPMHSMPNGEMMPGESHSEEPQMGGPLSGKAKREQVKSIQDLSLKKKAWLAEEQRKQELHQQKMRLAETKAKQANQQSARQSQE